MDFNYKKQLETAYPDLKFSLLQTHKSSDLMNLKFATHKNVSDDILNDDAFNKIQHILTPHNLHETTKIFSASRWSFGGHAFELSEIPSAGQMALSDSFHEVCLCGQSNAGKSSLVNCVMGSQDFHQGLAVVSKKAGRTRMLNFYSIPFHFSLVDMMGYGFALNVDKKIREYWLNFMKKYFTKRLEQHLKHVFVLIDTDFFVKRFKKHENESNHILSPNDEKMLSFLDDCYVPYSLVLTKVDSINDQNWTMDDSGTRLYNQSNANDSTKFDEILEGLKPVFDKYFMIQPFINVTSARLGFGITELQSVMSELCQLAERENLNMTELDINEIINSR